MLDELTSAVVRGAALRTLRLWLNRDRPAGEDSLEAYMSEDLLQAHVAGFENVRVPIGELRAQLTYMQDKGLVKYKEIRIGRETYLRWRILADGVELLEGNRTVPGIRV